MVFVDFALRLDFNTEAQRLRGTEEVVNAEKLRLGLMEDAGAG